MITIVVKELFIVNFTDENFYGGSIKMCIIGAIATTTAASFSVGAPAVPRAAADLDRFPYPLLYPSLCPSEAAFQFLDRHPVKK